MNESLKDVAYTITKKILIPWASAEKNSGWGKKNLWGKFFFFRGNFLLPEKSLYAISHKLLTGAQPSTCQGVGQSPQADPQRSAPPWVGAERKKILAKNISQIAGNGTSQAYLPNINRGNISNIVRIKHYNIPKVCSNGGV